MENDIYTVDATELEQAIFRKTRNQLIAYGVFLLVAVLFNVVLLDGSVFDSLLIVSLVAVFAYWTETTSSIRPLRKYREAAYRLTESSISLILKNEVEKELQFDHITTKEEDDLGMLFATGGKLDKAVFHLLKSPNLGKRFAGGDRIFIPKATNSYEKLIKEINTHSNIH